MYVIVVLDIMLCYCWNSLGHSSNHSPGRTSLQIGSWFIMHNFNFMEEVAQKTMVSVILNGPWGFISHLYHMSCQEKHILEMKAQKGFISFSAKDLEKNSFINICLVLFSAMQSKWAVSYFLFNSYIVFKLPTWITSIHDRVNGTNLLFKISQT